MNAERWQNIYSYIQQVATRLYMTVMYKLYKSQLVDVDSRQELM